MLRKDVLFKEPKEIFEIDVSGSKITGEICSVTPVGPKHFGIILGEDKQKTVYVAESMTYGYDIDTYDNFVERYANKGEIQIIPNTGEYSNLEVAKRAMSEILEGGKGKYNLITNNCETFSNRVMHNDSSSPQVITTVVGIAILVGIHWIIKTSTTSKA